jgi:hypothetical protein
MVLYQIQTIVRIEDMSIENGDFRLVLDFIQFQRAYFRGFNCSQIDSAQKL